MNDLDPSKTNDISAMVFINLLLMNTILCPIIMAALASRMQAVLFQLITAPYETGGFSRQAGLFLSLFLTLFLTALCIFILQLNLSLRFRNQLTPVFISIGGTFAGLFSWFLNRWPLQYLIPWGYYAVLCNTGYTYDEASRYITYHIRRNSIC